MAIPIKLSERDSLVKSASTVLNSKVVCQYSSLLSQLAINATLALVDPAHPDLLDLRSRGGPRLASSDPSGNLEVRRGVECDYGLDVFGRRVAGRGSSWARSGKLRCASQPLMSSAAMLCARAAISAVAKGDEDGNGDSMREEDVKGDWSGMVLILEIFSGI
uniref:Uncharacterized protein n=1 Tax=Oryza rufipogon TaxID=4529 RepID=A0A0E0NCV0_ORYRU